MVLHPHIAKLAVEAHIDDLRQDVRGAPRSPEDGDAPSRPRRRRIPVPRVIRRPAAKPSC